MISEIIAIVSGNITFATIHFLLFISFLIMVFFFSKRYTPPPLCKKNPKISVVMAVYKEDIDVLEKSLSSLANEGDELIIIHDDGDLNVRKIAKKYGAKVVTFPNRMGKKFCLTVGWRLATGDVIVHVDSDTVVEKGSVRRLASVICGDVVGAQGRIIPYAKKWNFVSRIAYLYEYARDTVCKALSGKMSVVDGRFNAWSRDFLLSTIDKFLVEKDVGDDKILTVYANEKYKTVYVSDAIAYTLVHHSFV